ncbi:MAG: 1-(5-phosphoribosyl)-5-[(5-phosphoribosylamino)methylideneamino]imidazole-4-carboxamide isomerase [Candidatus Omnitrophica bacterium]|nr:1-(5-phosphoribosyl)-5-[(5-phosphoribosylamino)methylideneamino]imidazole-4-carboxamide isomerase [Candidatus Omnitrophota bacterium]
MLVIPAIDIKESKVVRLEKGEFDKVSLYSDNPLEVALFWEREGAEILHIVDLEGALLGIPRNLDLIKEIVKNLKIPVQVGGGIRRKEDIVQLLEAGVKRIVMGTRACEDIDWLKTVIEDCPAKIIVSLDIKDGFLATEGWTKKTVIKPEDFVRDLTNLGMDTFILTDIKRDGTLKGIRIDYISEFLSRTNIKVIVAGGVGSLEDLQALRAISDKGVIGVIIGKALYEKKFTFKEARKIAE